MQPKSNTKHKNGPSLAFNRVLMANLVTTDEFERSRTWNLKFTLCCSLLLYLRVFSGQSRAFSLPCILKFDISAGHLVCLFAYIYLLKQWKSSCWHLSEEPVAWCLWTEYLIKWCWTIWGNWRIRPKINVSISTKVGEPLPLQHCIQDKKDW